MTPIPYIHTKVVHRNMLFLLELTVDEIPGDRDEEGLLDHQACTQQGGATDKMNPVKILVCNIWGIAVRMSHSILGWWRSLLSCWNTMPLTWL